MPDIANGNAVDLRTARQSFSSLGWSLFVTMALAAVLQMAAGIVIDLVWPQGEMPTLIFWLATFVPTYLSIGVGLLLMKKVPADPPAARPLPPGRFLSAALISVFMMMAGNLLGSLFLALLQRVLGLASVNPLLAYTADDAIWLRIATIAILSPILEECLFRRQLIDRMRVYGERMAVIVSALLFGLFHANLSQFFYACTLGLVFGYVYIRTGRLRYTVALHIFINFLGSVLAPLLQSGIDYTALETVDANDAAAVQAILPQLLPFMIYALVMALLSLVGLVLFFLNVGKLCFAPAAQPLPRGTRLKTVCLNAGMLMFLVICLILIAWSFVVGN